MSDTKRNFSPHFNLNQRKAFPCLNVEQLKEEEKQRRAEEGSCNLRVRAGRPGELERPSES